VSICGLDICQLLVDNMRRMKLMIYSFYDVSSGGTQKTPHKIIYIKANNEEEAIKKFEDYFDRDPLNTSCDCCGEDFAIDTVETINENDFVIE
jgi:hypothetical protein